MALNIRRFRRAFVPEMTQGELGSAAGVGQTQVSNWEKGKGALPNGTQLIQLALKLGVTVEALLEGVDPQYDASRDLLGQGRKVQRTPHQSGESVDPASDREIARLRGEIEEYKEVLAQLENAASTLATVIAAGEQVGKARVTQSKTRRRHRKAS